jgi:hypothetical protein
MASAAFRKALNSDLPILFVNIGWAIYYDGTEAIVGNHKYLREHPGERVGETRAFVPDDTDGFECGAGYGKMPSSSHVVFVARDPSDRTIKAVGVYAAANTATDQKNWTVVRTEFAERIPVENRQKIGAWLAGQGMRRWAKCDDKVEHKDLFSFFNDLVRAFSRKHLPVVKTAPADDEDGWEGALRKSWVRQRKREHKNRQRKIEDAIRIHGRLMCEVPGCGFDFRARYGELGDGFAEVHHKKPLSYAPPRGQKVPLSELAIVCANCHRMIHRNGQCRPLDVLMPL